MEIVDLLTPDSVMPHLHATCKKQVIQELAKHAADETDLSERQIFDVLLERERLGSTAVGEGIAIPHGRLPGLDRPLGMFAKLDEPIDFDALDERPVDLVFLLLAPEESGADHLKALSRISKLLRDENVRDRLRASANRESVFSVLTDAKISRAA